MQALLHLIKYKRFAPQIYALLSTSPNKSREIISFAAIKHSSQICRYLTQNNRKRGAKWIMPYLCIIQRFSMQNYNLLSYMQQYIAHICPNIKEDFLLILDLHSLWANNR